jgi:lipoyl(octanoyl) transferase
MPLTQVLHLGTLEYGPALQLQQTLVRLRQQGRIADTLLLLEHPPVITLGRNARAANIVASPQALAQRGVEVHEIDRGGDVTFHGPGQLVGYPIVDLRGRTPRLGPVEFVRKLEETLIRVCTEHGIPARRVAGLTGVWTQTEPERKLAALGVHISRAVTSHGFALNVTTDLDQFRLIVPCGIADRPVTSMAAELGARAPAMEAVLPSVTRHFGHVFGTQILWLESLESLLAGADAAPANQDTPLRTPDELRRLEDELRGCDDISDNA